MSMLVNVLSKLAFGFYVLIQILVQETVMGGEEDGGSHPFMAPPSFILPFAPEGSLVWNSLMGFYVFKLTVGLN